MARGVRYVARFLVHHIKILHPNKLLQKVRKHLFLLGSVVVAAALVVSGVVHTVVKKVRDRFDERVKRRRYYQRLMAAANTYEQWRELAEQLYKLEQMDAPDRQDKSKETQREVYDRKLLLEKTQHLRKIRATANVKEIMFSLRIDLIRNVANIAKR